MGFIAKFILPESVDFVSALRQQTELIREIVRELRDACVQQEPDTFGAIRASADRAAALKKANMKLLLDVFLTPFDKESIYRLITQLDWVALSVKHFVIEREVYGVSSLAEYADIYDVLNEMASLLDRGCGQLAGENLLTLEETAEQIHDRYDRVVEKCARAIAQQFEEEDFRSVMRHRDIVAQLKEIAKRIRVSANTLQDMAIKIV